MQPPPATCLLARVAFRQEQRKTSSLKVVWYLIKAGHVLHKYEFLPS
jgi:hypothetical protein